MLLSIKMDPFYLVISQVPRDLPFLDSPRNDPILHQALFEVDQNVTRMLTTFSLFTSLSLNFMHK